MYSSWVLLVFFLTGSVFPLSSDVAAAFPVAREQTSTYTGNIQGEITAKSNGAAIPHAIVEATELGLSATTDSTGHFSWHDIPMQAPSQPISIKVSAPGYGDWTIRNVLLLADDTLILTPRLTDSPIIEDMPSRSEYPDSMIFPTRVHPPFTEPISPLSADITNEIPEDFIPPSTIRVGVTGDWRCNPNAPYTIEVVDFKYYVKHVLPNEWEGGWPQESYRAGAIAVKMYAWYWINHGGKWKSKGFDVFDSTCDQWYRPSVEWESTNRAIDYTWYWLLTRNNQLIPIHYYADICPPDWDDCMSQTGSRDMALAGSTWDEIVYFYYPDTLLSYLAPFPAGFNLRFDGTLGDEADENRVFIAVDDPANGNPGPPVDIGAQDFTIEWWMKASATENTAPAIACGTNKSWTNGNILLDRSRVSPGNQYGVSLGAGRVSFGVTGSDDSNYTLCATKDVTDNEWHHVAVQRRISDGRLWIFVDGNLEASADGPTGDISYPDTTLPSAVSDPYLGISAWKLNTDQQLHPFYRGWIDELRFSNILRYTSTFTPTNDIFTTDSNTVALYHLDEGIQRVIGDTSGASGGPSNGTRYYGGTTNGPEWMPSDLFLVLSKLFTPEIYK